MAEKTFESTAPRPPWEDQRDVMARWLHRPRYEVLPFAGTADQVEQHVPKSLPVTVTASPRLGLEATVELTEALASRGFSTVPHLAARLVYDENHLSDTLTRLQEVGVRDVFVIAGDGETPVGDFSDSTQLLTAISRLRRSSPPSALTRVGVAGYPEGHPIVDDDDLFRALLDKQPLASYVVTQMCFDARAVGRWVGRARGLGLRLPVHAGVAGAVDQLKLLRVAKRIGVGSSVRFLRKHRGGAKLVRSGGYRPDRLLNELAADDIHPECRLSGLHLYTFGDVAGTERWRTELLARLTDGDHADG